MADKPQVATISISILARRSSLPATQTMCCRELSIRKVIWLVHPRDLVSDTDDISVSAFPPINSLELLISRSLMIPRQVACRPKIPAQLQQTLSRWSLEAASI